MNEQIRRRWFRFSLRTVFVLVTVLCIWLGWESSVVRRRQAVLKELRANPVFHVTTAEAWKQRYPAGFPAPSAAKVSRVRTWLGDEAIQEIWHSWHQPPSQDELRRLAAVFPEAEMREALPEPCHPGCFPRGTLVDTPQGPRPIETIQPGDFLTAILPTGEPLPLEVQSVFVTDNRLWRVETEEGALLTTETQPLCLAAGNILAAGKLQPGDRILRLRDGELRSVRVLNVSRTERAEKVFNVVLGDCEIFVAHGFLARSKPPPVLKPPRLPAERRVRWSVSEGATLSVGEPGAVESAGRFGDFVLQREVRIRERLVIAGVFFGSMPGELLNGCEGQVFSACYAEATGQPVRYSTGAIDDRQLTMRLVQHP